MEIDVNLHKPPNGIELKTISAGSYSHNQQGPPIHNHQHHHNHHHHHHHNNNNSNNNNNSLDNNHQARLRSISPPPPAPGLAAGCCGILTRLLCSNNNRGKTGTSSGDYSSAAFYNGAANGVSTAAPQHPLYTNLLKKTQQHRRTPQEIYFESRGKSCKKLLKFNGNCNKVSSNNRNHTKLKSRKR